MGSFIEVNDTLQLTDDQGFPSNLLDLRKHLHTPITLKEVEEQQLVFSNKEGCRIFHLDPTRVFLVQNISGKWLFWGKAVVQSQTISKKVGANIRQMSSGWTTAGTYRIIDLYEPSYQELITRRESPAGKSYFR